MIKAGARDDLPTRIHLIATTVEEVIEELDPDVLAIERAFHGVNGQSALRLGEARGAIMHVAVQHGLPVFEYAPAHVKRVIVGHGRATKAEIQHRVTVLCRLRKVPAVDAADALAIALCHGQQHDAATVAARAAAR